METTRIETTRTEPTAADIRRKAAEYDARGNHETAAILRAVADEIDAATLEEDGSAVRGGFVPLA